MREWQTSANIVCQKQHRGQGPGDRACVHHSLDPPRCRPFSRIPCCSTAHARGEAVQRGGEKCRQGRRDPRLGEFPEIRAEAPHPLPGPCAQTCYDAGETGLRTYRPSEHERKDRGHGHPAELVVVVPAVTLDLGHDGPEILGIVAEAPGEQPDDDPSDDTHQNGIETSEPGREPVPD